MLLAISTIKGDAAALQEQLCSRTLHDVHEEAVRRLLSESET